MDWPFHQHVPCSYVHGQWPSLLDRYKNHEVLGAFWKMARVGERATAHEHKNMNKSATISLAEGNEN